MDKIELDYIQEIRDKLSLLKSSDEQCIIVAEHMSEANIAGSRSAYINLCSDVINMLCKSYEYNSEYFEDDAFVFSDIKNSISEYGDCFIVGAIMYEKTKDYFEFLMHENPNYFMYLRATQEEFLKKIGVDVSVGTLKKLIDRHPIYQKIIDWEEKNL